MATAAAETMPRTRYHLEAREVEACNCQLGCNCQFEGWPNEGKCEFVLGLDVIEGSFGDTDLSGVRAVLAMQYPGAIHEGNGKVALFVDESASDAQAQAMAEILSGRAGGMPWEAMRETMARFEGPLRVPIELDPSPRRARIRAGDAVELSLAPLTNPKTGAEKQVQIVYPNGGFWWDVGDTAQSERLRVRHKDIAFEYTGKYASTSTVEWPTGA
ncbi:MAG: DUF1326 domain-containing protein [Longimicrobiales bacterium]